MQSRDGIDKQKVTNEKAWDDGMPEGVKQPGNTQLEPAEAQVGDEDGQESAEQQLAAVAATEGAVAPVAEVIIWTPRFIVFFALALVIGLSAEGLCAELTLIRTQIIPWVLLAHIVGMLACWITLVVVSRSMWMRLGGVFGCIWALFTGISVMQDELHFAATASTSAYLGVIVGCALLGAYLCLSTGHGALVSWDNWVFRLAVIGGVCAIALAYGLTAADARSITSLARDIATTALCVCALVWWLRPSCWRREPGPTFLYGLAPMITLFLAIPGAATAETSFFLAQVSLLCLLLATVRIIRETRLAHVSLAPARDATTFRHADNEGQGVS